jgi:hypothetical protein
MMDEHLKRYLAPGDDGLAFTEAVLFRASGALARRRQAAAEGPTWSLLEIWARPWVIAVVLLLAFAIVVPSRPWSVPPTATADAGLTADALLGAATDSEVVLSVALGN